MTNPSLLIKRSIKSAASIAKAGLGYPQTANGSIHVVAYHRVVADIAKAEREAVYGIVVSSGTFRRHCEMLRRSYDVVSLETAMHFLERGRSVARPMAVITFDDGYQDFYDEAFPVLNELGLPATVFLPTGYIGKETPLPHDRIFWLLKIAMETSTAVPPALRRVGLEDRVCDSLLKRRDLLKATDSLVYLPNELREAVIGALEIELGNRFKSYPSEYRLLDWDMIREMSRKGINFGSHTVDHVILPLESHDIVQSELTESKIELERELGKRIISFAYPNGEYNETIRSAALNAGYKVAVTTKTGMNTTGADLLSLTRTSLCEESTRGINGVYSAKVAGLRLGV